MSQESDSSDDDRLRSGSLVSNPDSYVTSRSGSVFEANSLQVYPTVQFNSNKKAYKTQIQCFICETQLGKSSFNISVKFNCKFCYNAVCSNCSPLSCLHPLTQRPERICMACYNTFVEEKSIKAASAGIKAELEKFSSEKNAEIAKREFFESKVKTLEKELEDTQIEFKLKIEEKNKINQELRETIKDRDKKIIDLEKEINSKLSSNTENNNLTKTKAVATNNPKSGSCGCLII
jgi:hypothetical protein